MFKGALKQADCSYLLVCNSAPERLKIYLERPKKFEKRDPYPSRQLAESRNHFRQLFALRQSGRLHSPTYLSALHARGGELPQRVMADRPGSDANHQRARAGWARLRR